MSYKLNPPDQQDIFGNRKTKSITDNQFLKLAGYLSSKYGLRVPIEKKMMFESRFTRRLNALNLSDFSEYFHQVLSAKNQDEYLHFIDLVTTHKTFFFREEYQFEFLKNIIPVYNHQNTRRSLNVWSAGCSTGEEVYTIGMVLNESKGMGGFDFNITGTDISIPALQKAAQGVYSPHELSNILPALKDKYFNEIPENGGSSLIFNNTEIKSKIKLGVLNLNNPVYRLDTAFDFIFCRNVIIYFDAATQRRVLEKLVNKLRPGGYLFLGHSETAIGSSLPIRSVQPTIYQKR